MDDFVENNPAVAGTVSWETATLGPPPDYAHFPEVRAGINARPLPSPTGPKLEITDAQKTGLYRDGFLVIKDAAPLDLTRIARERAEQGGRYPVRLKFPVSPEYASGRLPPVEVPHGA